MVQVLKSKIHFLMPTWFEALHHGLRVAIDVEFVRDDWELGRKLVCRVIKAFYDLKEVARWPEPPPITLVPRAGTKFCLQIRFRNLAQAQYLKAMLYRVAQEQGWAFEDNV